MLLDCLCVNCFFGLGLVEDLIFSVVDGMKSDKVVSAIEYGFFHLTGWGRVVMKTVKWMIWMGCAISEV